MYQKITLQDFRQRALDCIAAWISGDEQAHVILSSRGRKPVAVSLANHRIVVRPEAGLYDLFLCAQLLRFREVIGRRGPHRLLLQYVDDVDAPETDAFVCPEEDVKKRIWRSVKKYAQRAHTQIAQRFPSIVDQTSGFCHPNRSPQLTPEVAWSEVSWSKLRRPTATGFSLSDNGQTLELVNPGELEVVISAIEQGQFPVQRVPELPFPIAAIHDKMIVGEDVSAARDQLDAAIDERACVIQEFVHCYRIHSQSMINRRFNHQRCWSGLRLDTNRLARVGAGVRRGHPNRLFKQPNPDYGRVFDPRHHLALFGFDLNVLFVENQWKRQHPALPAILAKTLDKLRINAILRGYLDRLVRFPDGRLVLIHIELELKNLDEPFDDVVWNRFAWIFRRAERRRDPFPLAVDKAEVMPVGLTAFHLSRLTSNHDRVQSERQFPNRTLFLISDFDDNIPDELDTEFQTSQAEWMESQLDRLETSYPKSYLDRRFIYLPRALYQTAPPDSKVSEYRSFGETAD